MILAAFSFVGIHRSVSIRRNTRCSSCSFVLGQAERQSRAAEPSGTFASAIVHITTTVIVCLRCFVVSQIYCNYSRSDF